MELQSKLDGLTVNLIEQKEMSYISKSLIAGVHGVIIMGLKDKNNYHAVLNMLCGPAIRALANVYPIEHTYNLTAPVAAYLINLFLLPTVPGKKWRLNDYAKTLLEECENTLEEQVV